MKYRGPTYGETPKEYLKSVDLALALILMLRDDGTVNITDASISLGVAPSTIHRSMSMLAFRGFATKSESRTYYPGPALNSTALEPGVGNWLITAAKPYMHAISAKTSETCHLQVLSGAKCHFLYSVEGSQPVRVGTRQGQVMPAEQNSGGLAMLAEMSAGELRALYPTTPNTDFDEFRRTLHRTRSRGFSINNGRYEHDVSAVGTCIRNELGDVLGAVTVAIPTARFRGVHHQCADVLLRYVRELNQTLKDARPSEPYAIRG